MKIVIDIDENVYTRLFDAGENTMRDMRVACSAIRKGTPLPKGHERLIDADNVNNHIIGSVNLRDCPTIIEADKEEEE